MIKARKDAATGGKLVFYKRGRGMSLEKAADELYKKSEQLMQANARVCADNDELRQENARLRAKYEAVTENLEECQTELNRVYTAIGKLKQHIDSGSGFIANLLKL